MTNTDMLTKLEQDPAEHWLISVRQDDAWGGLRYVDGQLVFEGDHVDATARAFFDSLRDVAQRCIDEVAR